MKGYRFYEELENKNRKGEKSKGTVIALALFNNGAPDWRPSMTSYHADCVSAVFDEPNSPVCWGAVCVDYLRKRARRVSEVKAREIHPALFEYLDGR